MSKHLLTLGVVLIVAVVASVGWDIPQAWAQRARVPRTGQTECWDAVGDPITCAGTGQDGETKTGVSLPTPRFVNNGTGMVTDRPTGLIWLQNANCFGVRTWLDALTAANTLADDPDSTTTDCGLSDGSEPGDWRLPNVKELHSLIDFGHADPALPSGHPFAGVQTSDIYWTSTTVQGGTAVRAWFVAMILGISFDENKANPHLVWPVRGGN